MVMQKLKIAINELIDKDSFLFHADANERSITHKLAEYIQLQFQNWNVDCEYNRNGHGDTKTLDLPISHLTSEDAEARTVFPDIIVHQRGTNDNLLVIEVKKSNNRLGTSEDIKKLMAFKSQLNYQNAVSILIDIEGEPSYTVEEV